MLSKALVSAALLMSGLALPGAAVADPAYRGGPKSGVSTVAPKPAYQTNKPYAAYEPAARANEHAYQGGPKSTIPHTPRRQ